MGLVSVMATHRDMADHDNQMVHQLSLGHILQQPMKVLNEKHIKLGIFHWLPLSAKKLRTNKEAFERTEARAGHRAVDDDPCIELILPEHMTGLGEAFKMLCKFVSDSDAIFVSTDEKSGRSSRRLPQCTNWPRDPIGLICTDQNAKNNLRAIVHHETDLRRSILHVP